MDVNVTGCDTYWVKIYMAGDLSLAKQVCRKFCVKGLCINIQEMDYIYTFGEESGFCIELINYARFPKTNNQITNDASELAELLMEELYQRSYTIMTPEKTYWISRK